MSGGDFAKEINATTNIRNRINCSGLQFFSSFLLVKISSIKIGKIKPFLLMISFGVVMMVVACMEELISLMARFIAYVL